MLAKALYPLVFTTSPTRQNVAVYKDGTCAKPVGSVPVLRHSVHFHLHVCWPDLPFQFFEGLIPRLYIGLCVMTRAIFCHFVMLVDILLFLVLRSKIPLGKVMLDRVSIVRSPRGRQGVGMASFPGCVEHGLGMRL